MKRDALKATALDCEQSLLCTKVPGDKSEMYELNSRELRVAWAPEGERNRDS